MLQFKIFLPTFKIIFFLLYINPIFYSFIAFKSPIIVLPMSIQKTALIILDGWGLVSDPAISAIAAARTPFFDNIISRFSNATLVTHGESVGLPDGQMGNSEVGHLNIGAGRIIYQELARIHKAIRDGSLKANPVLQHVLATSTGTIHLMGLVSDGGVHSHIDHLIALAEICRDKYSGPIRIHAFTDGRDTDPQRGLAYLEQLTTAIAPLDIPIASVVGRYYAMDRDRRWERTKLAYDLLVHGQGEQTKDPLIAVRNSYEKGITDEFILPIVVTNDQGKPLGTIQPGDTVIFFNFRTDRPRQITDVLCQHEFPEFDMQPLPLRMVTMTPYDHTFQNIDVIFPENDIRHTLGEYISECGLTQLRAAETEKYPHVSFFFSGGREDPFPGEARLLIPSPKVATYDLKPEMSAPELTDAVLDFAGRQLPDFICLNYANTDMVGHTGIFSAAVRAAETVDQCLSRLVPFCLGHGYSMIIIADHGNADIMVNPDGSPHTAHTLSPVPVLYIPQHPDHRQLRDGKLADIAPTILRIMGLDIPPMMSGEVLLYGE